MDFASITRRLKQTSKLKNSGGSSKPDNRCDNQRKDVVNSRKSKGESVDVDRSKKILRPPSLIPTRPKVGLYSAKYSQFQTYSEKQETTEEKRKRLTNLLMKYDSPFKWRPKEVEPLSNHEIIINRIQEKDKEVIDERKFKWRNFIFHLVISYESWQAKKLSQAFEEVCGLEKLLQLQSNRGEFMFSCIEDALWHVVLASKAFLCLEQDTLSDAEKLIDRILPYQSMSRSNKAGIHGIKAAMFMEYGHRGNENALSEAFEAVNLDRTVAEWHFYICKCLGRLRRVAKCHELVDPMEVRAINNAIKLDERNATYKVFLGQVLAERAFREYRIHKPDKKGELYGKIRKTNYAAMNTFKTAVELSPNSPHILIRCAKGLMRLPPALKDLPFTKECIEKALKLAPNNPMVHHVQAMYHERYDCDVELQLNAYETADYLNNFGASLDLVKLHRQLKTGDVIAELEMLASRYKQTEKLQVVYTQAGSYLLFIEKDFVGALKYFLKVVQINKKSYAMKSHKPMFLRLCDPVNMFEVLRMELATRTEWASFPSEDRKVLKDMRIQLMDYEPDEDYKGLKTVEDILEMSRKTIENSELYNQRKLNKRINRSSGAKKKKTEKKWVGKTKKDESKSNKSKKINSKAGKTKNHSREEGKSTFNKTKRRDSLSSSNSVDSNYYRDSTQFGPRGFFLQSDENLCSAQDERFGSYKQDHTSDMTNIGSSIDYSLKRKASRDLSSSSRSSISSAYSNVSFHNKDMVYPHTNTTEQSQLTFENVKKFDFHQSYDTSVQRLSLLSLSNATSIPSACSNVGFQDNMAYSPTNTTEQSQPTFKNVNKFDFNQSYDTSVRRLSSLSLSNSPSNTTEQCQQNIEKVKKFDFETSYDSNIRRLSLLSLSNASLASQTSSTNTLSVMDRVKQSYSMLGHKNERHSGGKKTNRRNHGSTQSLNMQHTDDWKKDSANKNIGRSESSQSLNKIENNLDRRYLDNLITSRNSSVESGRSFTFMPGFAQKP